jgi:hypothetical protein
MKSLDIAASHGSAVAMRNPGARCKQGRASQRTRRGPPAWIRRLPIRAISAPAETAEGL